METRRLGRTDLQVGMIGLGTEHMERSPEVMGAVLGEAVPAGVTYIDLVYTNPQGRDAAFWDPFTPVLQAYRERLVLAGHWGPSDMYTPEECQHNFDDVLNRVGNGYVEVAFLTVVDTERTWAEWAQRSLEMLHRYQEQGRVGFIGMSGHRAPVALQAIRSGLIDVLMFQINLLGHADLETAALAEACREHDVGLVAMKPYHGGTLFRAEGQPSGITPAQCLAYVFAQPVAVAVPGVRNLEEMQATLGYLEATDEEKDYRGVTTHLAEYLAGQCVYCSHCLPCPQEIDIGWTIWLLDNARAGVTEELRGWYADYPVKASACSGCGECLERCPFGVDIIARLHQVVEVFGE